SEYGVALDLAPAGDLPGSRGYTADARPARGGRDEPRGEVGVSNHLLTGPRGVVRHIKWSAGRVPPVALGIDRADVACGQGIDGQPGEGKELDVVLMDHHVGARTTDQTEIAQTDRVTRSGYEVVVQDAQVGVVVEETDGRAPDEGAVGDAVVVNGRVVGVEPHDSPAVHVEQVRGDLEVKNATCRI